MFSVIRISKLYLLGVCTSSLSQPTRFGRILEPVTANKLVIVL